ncbi:hypothetical protein EV421DRAFT_1845039 [Armillaria borealis]|uniref:Uncharacterized protein n=1 Tax=Armillaria borealis TaxID=47425 RepID=A0AA39J0X0_9AGAR|nr:hypothetical protein EV421DRAFT_1845039 [Armillaria borealis]
MPLLKLKVLPLAVAVHCRLQRAPQDANPTLKLIITRHSSGMASKSSIGSDMCQTCSIFFSLYCFRVSMVATLQHTGKDGLNPLDRIPSDHFALPSSRQALTWKFQMCCYKAFKIGSSSNYNEFEAPCGVLHVPTCLMHGLVPLFPLKRPLVAPVVSQQFVNRLEQA